MNNNNPRLTRRDISHNAACSCECWQYPHTKGTNNQYKCINCNHRLTPPDPLSQNGPKFDRFNSSSATAQGKGLKINNSQPLPSARTLQNPLGQQPREKNTSFPDLRYVDQRRSD